MSNQRAGKTHKAALGDGMQEMKMKIFFAHCADILEESGQEDAAFTLNRSWITSSLVRHYQVTIRKRSLGSWEYNKVVSFTV